MHIKLGTSTYYFVAFIDEYSRYIVHWELAEDALKQIIGWYNEERLHSS